MNEDLLRHRERFPVFAERTYLATACLGPFPSEAHRDVEDYVRTRELHNRALGVWFERIEELVQLVEQLLLAPPGSIALRDSATACQAAVLSCVEPGGAGRNRIVVTELDFHSSLHLYGAQRRRGFDIHIVRSRDGTEVATSDLTDAIDERTAVVAVSMVSRDGALLDVAPVVARARAAGAMVVLDVYQAVGVIPIDVSALDVDVLVGGTHKWLSGATGVAFLYVRPEVAERLQPVYPGWFGHAELGAYVRKHTFGDAYRPMPGARRFQQGTPGVLPIYASRAGIEFVLEVGVDRIRERNLVLTTHLIRGAEAAGLDIATPREAHRRGGYVCFRVPDPEAAVGALEERGIDVDQRRREVVRVAPHACSTVDECDEFLRSFTEIARAQRG